jgi:BlaI family penicillinase repressor
MTDAGANDVALRKIDVTQTELAILEVLWQRGSATIREITDEIYAEGTTGEYATVQKLLERLESKGCVCRDRRSFAHVFTPAIERSALIDQGLQRLAEQLCGGSLTPLLMHLVEGVKLTPAQRRKLRELIDRSKPPR